MNDPLSSLERLSRLRDSGALTEDEFLAEKAKLLRPPDGGASEPRRTRLPGARAQLALAAGLLVLLLAGATWWWFSPLWTLREMQSAVRARDADAFSKYVDFPSLRSDLKADAMAEMATKARGSDDSSDGLAMLGAAMVGPLIDGLISPDGVRAMFAAKKPDDGDLGLLDAAAGGGKVVRTGLTEFQVRGATGDVLEFSLHGFRWKLSGMDPAPKRSLARTATPAPAGNAAGLPAADSGPSFRCSGAFSNVSFSSESGDGSGVFARVRADGDVSLTFWEGGPSRAAVATTSVSPDRLGIRITFPDDPEQLATGSLACRGGKLIFRSDELGHNATLSPVGAARAAELDG